MLRQNPIQKKRNELNLKPRLLKPKSGSTDPVVPVSPPPVPKLSIPESPIPPISTSPISTSPVLQPRSAAPVSLSPRGNYEEKLEYYRIPRILSSLLAGPDPQLISLLQEGLEKSRESKDEIYEAVFAGAIAANENPPDIAKAVRNYHRAFDLSEKRQEKPDGFLHGMVWNLFAHWSDHEDVVHLLDRARSELQNTPPRSDEDIRIRRIRDALMEDVEFRRTYEEGQKKLDGRNREFDRRISRPGRLSPERALLFFPDACRREKSGDFDFQEFFPSMEKKSYFISLNGFGSVIDPGLSFFNAFDRLGGSLDDLRNVVFSSSRAMEPSWFEWLRTLYDRHPPVERVRLIVTPDVVRRFDEELCSLEESGIAETVRFARPSEAELIGGTTISMQSGSIVLKTPSGKTIQFADLSGSFRPDTLISDPDILVLSGTDLFTAIHWAEKKRPALAVFDSKEIRYSVDSADAIRRYLGGEIAWAVADSMLICDVESRQFLDAVKAFDHPDDPWTEFDKMGSAVHPTGIYYFDRESRERFEDEQKEMVDSFLFYRNRRRNLYFVRPIPE